MRSKTQVAGRLFAVLAVLFACATVAAPLSGQEVRLRNGDTIKIDVPQRDELSRVVTIDDRGQVTLPLIGAVKLGGLTTDEARATLLRALQELYPSVQSVTVTLAGEEGRRYIYVQGQVARPGKFEITAAPTPWDAIKEAGGPTNLGDLSAVRIIRIEGQRSSTSEVDVQAILDSGDLVSLPKLKPGDTVVVPDRTTGYAGSGLVGVIGAVMHPGSYVLSGERRLLDAVLAAGGAAEGANLGKIKIIRPKAVGGSDVMGVNLARYLKKGDIRDNPVLQPSDVVSVPSRGALRTVFTAPGYLVGIVTALATTAVVIVFARR
jgi:polysaccharide export outer membrane protein